LTEIVRGRSKVGFRMVSRSSNNYVNFEMKEDVNPLLYQAEIYICVDINYMYRLYLYVT